MSTPSGNPPLSATATWGGDWRSRRLAARVGSGHTITLDSAHVGQSTAATAGASPMETLLVALVGCLGMSALPMLRKTRLDITAYDLRVTGQRSAAAPVVFTAITVEHIVTGHALDNAAVAAAIELGEERYCGVSAMLRQAVPITHTVTLREAGEDGALDG